MKTKKMTKSKARVIYSFFSPKSDLLSNGSFNKKGANFQLHELFFDKYNFDKHVLLCTLDYEKEAEKLKQFINLTFKNKIEIKVFSINTEELLTNSSVLQVELEKEFKKYDSSYELYFLFNPGFGLIKYVIKELENKYSLRILFLNYSEKSSKPSLIWINEKANYEYTADIAMPNALKAVYEKATKIATTNENVIITGETGTGKEILARYIHNNSLRSQKPYQAINCSAFRPELLESRLFGHRKGSFTDASEDRKGIFEECDKGTVFLDEIGDIDKYMQQLLLRFLQFKEIQPIGQKVKKVDVRIIAATNKNLYQEVQNGNFRYDLFYRLGFFLHLPSIREYSINDKKLIIEYFQKQKMIELNKNSILQFEPSLYDFLLSYSYPGNYRELETIMKHLYIYSKNNIATLNDLPEFVFDRHKCHQNKESAEVLSLKEAMSQYCKKVFAYNNSNMSKTAKDLKISLNTLKKYLK